jgi:hypothetical protein
MLDKDEVENDYLIMVVNIYNELGLFFADSDCKEPRVI